MERTYNVFVDNGLYVLGYYLHKDIEDIIMQDLKDSTELFATKFTEYEKCEYYKKNIDMGFHNSKYTQPVKKDSNKKESVVEQYNLILDNMGDDEICSICGEKHIKLDADEKYLSSLSRCLMPHIHSNTFVNYINNLQMINICPVCIYLSLISLFNFQKAGASIVLYNSDDNEFMEDYTYEVQVKLLQNINTQAKESKDKLSNITYIENTIENIINKGKLYDGYIKVLSFYNGGQSESYEEDLISYKDLNFIKNLQSKSLLPEFKLNHLFSSLIKGNLQNNYLNGNVIDKEYKLKISNELFNEIEGVYCKMSNEKLQLIKEICNEVYKTNDTNEIKQLKGVSTVKQFEEILMEWNEKYQEKSNKPLFDMDTFDLICNPREFSTIKNRMLVYFSTLN